MRSIGFGVYGEDPSKFKGSAPIRLIKAAATIDIEKANVPEKKHYTVEMGVSPATILISLLAVGALAGLVHVWKTSAPR